MPSTGAPSSRSASDGTKHQGTTTKQTFRRGTFLYSICIRYARSVARSQHQFFKKAWLAPRFREVGGIVKDVLVCDQDVPWPCWYPM